MSRVRQESVDDTIRRLRTFCNRMERRYECSSDFARRAVANGYMKETREVCDWLQRYAVLERLKNGAPQ